MLTPVLAISNLINLEILVSINFRHVSTICYDIRYIHIYNIIYPTWIKRPFSLPVSDDVLRLWRPHVRALQHVRNGLAIVGF